MKLQFESWQFIFGARIFLTVRDLNLESISVLLIKKKWKKFLPKFLAIWSTVISWHILQLRGKLAIFCAVAADFQIIDSASAWSRDVTL